MLAPKEASRMSQYHVSRNGRTLGVYPEADAREYYAQGRIAAGDLVWREGMPAWVAAGEVFGPAPVAPAPAPAPAPPAWTELTPEGRVRVAGPDAEAVPLPPKLHWALVLLFTLLTLGIFFIVWIVIQAAWVKKIDPKSNALTLMVVYLVLVLAGELVSNASPEGSPAAAAGGLLMLIGTVVSIVGIFSMRRSMLDYYGKVEPIGLRLSGALTFFLGVFYLQHHMTRIAKWKETGVLSPQ
jgi:hypothetical protein